MYVKSQMGEMEKHNVERRVVELLAQKHKLDWCYEKEEARTEKKGIKKKFIEFGWQTT